MLDELGLYKLLIASLATYRLAQLISKDDGPFDFFKKLRLWPKKKAGYWQSIKNDENESTYKRFIGTKYILPLWISLSKFLECPYCTGVWFAALCLWLVAVPSIYGELFLAVFAIAGLQAFMQEVSS